MIQIQFLLKHRNCIPRIFRPLQYNVFGRLPSQYGNFNHAPVQVRLYSNPARKPNFFSQFLENIKQEMSKSKEMKESLKKFREETEKLEHSEALQSARRKYHAVESEASKSTEVLKEKLGTIKDKMQEALEEASKSDIAKKAGQITEEIGKSARGAAEKVSETGQKIGKTGAFQTLSETAKVVKKELDTSNMDSRVYRPPKKLRKRVETTEEMDSKILKPNTEATGVELHKDSRFYQSWQNFKDNNPYINKMLDWKTQYDESDNPLVRASRMFTDRVTDIMGGLFQKTELSNAMTELCALDPNFDKVSFIRQCETDIIPNILEAMVRGDLDILRDWCHDGPYHILSQPLRQAIKLNLKFDSKVLDIDNVDLTMGKVMEQGPVLMVSFNSQQIVCLRDKSGKVVEGDPNKILRVSYMWVLCRDRTELNPRAAWRLLDLSAMCNELLV